MEITTRRLAKCCAYCGVGNVDLTKDHVVPKCLYSGKPGSKVPRITVPCCIPCNQSWSDDEAHFRNVLLVAGEPNPAVRELWEGKARRSFLEPDGLRRMRELADQLVASPSDGAGRHRIYPAKDERILRVLRKIVRGLLHYHEIETAVADDGLSVDVLTYAIPEGFIKPSEWHHRERDIIEYWYRLYNDGETTSSWILRFFERRTFIAWVRR
jgi:hypothetical protein